MENFLEKLNRRRLENVNNLNGLPGRPANKKTRLFIDNEFFELGYAGIFPKYVLPVYGVLARHANNQTQTCFPSIKTIMRKSGVKNRNSVEKAIKILELYDMVAVARSRGRIPNNYKLLSHSIWRPPNSINIDTIRKLKKPPKTVSLNHAQQYQEQSPNIITNDTRSHIIKSDNKEIKENNNLKNDEPSSYEEHPWRDKERLRVLKETTKERSAGDKSI